MFFWHLRILSQKTTFDTLWKQLMPWLGSFFADITIGFFPAAWEQNVVCLASICHLLQTR